MRWSEARLLARRRGAKVRRSEWPTGDHLLESALGCWEYRGGTSRHIVTSSEFDRVDFAAADWEVLQREAPPPGVGMVPEEEFVSLDSRSSAITWLNQGRDVVGPVTISWISGLWREWPGSTPYMLGYYSTGAGIWLAAVVGNATDLALAPTAMPERMVGPTGRHAVNQQLGWAQNALIAGKQIITGDFAQPIGVKVNDNIYGDNLGTLVFSVRYLAAA